MKQSQPSSVRMHACATIVISLTSMGNGKFVDRLKKNRNIEGKIPKPSFDSNPANSRSIANDLVIIRIF